MAARKFQDLGIGTDEIEQVAPIEQMTRPLDAPELIEGLQSDGARLLLGAVGFDPHSG